MTLGIFAPTGLRGWSRSWSRAVYRWKRPRGVTWRYQTEKKMNLVLSIAYYVTHGLVTVQLSHQEEAHRPGNTEGMWTIHIELIRAKSHSRVGTPPTRTAKTGLPLSAFYPCNPAQVAPGGESPSCHTPPVMDRL
ncbi:hypothetical protein J6590_078831 [Homalodisca vitripennis]|nr:hypothetical protein J6590_078831 [Homalodisca vitripennis]